jgi:hypothetical protein
MNKTIKSFFLVLTVAFTTSCGPTLKVSSDYDRTVNFSAYKTYSIYNLKSKGSVNQLNEDRIIKYLNAEMAKRGFKQDNHNPDLMVNALTVLKDKRGVSATNYGYGGIYRPYGFWGAPGYTSISTYDYKDGSLVIDMIDAKTQRMVWTGSGSAEVYSKPKNPEQVISEVVGKIMAEFPIGATH